MYQSIGGQYLGTNNFQMRCKKKKAEKGRRELNVGLFFFSGKKEIGRGNRRALDNPTCTASTCNSSAAKQCRPPTILSKNTQFKV